MAFSGAGVAVGAAFAGSLAGFLAFALTSPDAAAAVVTALSRTTNANALSALTQALFPAADAKELRARIETPLPREVVLAKVEEMKTDFELVGRDAFMQTELTSAELDAASDPNEANQPTTPCLFLEVPRNSRPLLFRPASSCDTVCARCAVALVYGIQAFAMEDGKSGFGLRGKSPSVRGKPAATTLIVIRDERAARGVRAST